MTNLKPGRLHKTLSRPTASLTAAVPDAGHADYIPPATPQAELTVRQSSWRRAHLRILLVVVALTLGGCATLHIDGADRAQLADVASTSVALSSGLQEANPIMAPFTTNGPAGFVAMACIKLGLNRAARLQKPATCRQWLSISTAAGWGATTINLAAMTSPPLALVAIPVTVLSHNAARDGSALETCYEGLLADAILSVPEGTNLHKMPKDKQQALLRVIGFWPKHHVMHGTRPADGRVLVDVLLIDNLAGLNRMIEKFDLDWTVIGMQDRDGHDIVSLNPEHLMRHLPDDTMVAAHATDLQRPALEYDPSTGAITIHKHRRGVWQVAAGTQAESATLAANLRQGETDTIQD